MTALDRGSDQVAEIRFVDKVMYMGGGAPVTVTAPPAKDTVDIAEAMDSMADAAR
ncbi:hypothetical protein [Streptomyces sp. V4I2]|uniref:hypothetical protein n=1 Tax=Streptomyces sp. V4I2 TaxID=3042280 RepID=UPI00277D5440|nr:hypothetical protein [Streptomyces sp. V4I2]MDQ1047830.1 hypothetical protein [Streptomyces sp. V4I2]